MACVRKRPLSQSLVVTLALALSLLFSACGGGGSDDDDDNGGNGSADSAISISETFNLSASAVSVLEAKNRASTNGSGIGSIVLAGTASPQPGNGYTASTIDIANTATNSIADTLDFTANSPSLASDATAAQLAAFIETQNDDVDASASTTARLTLSTASIAFGDQFSINGATITGNTRSDVMADINALPSIVASIDGNGVITVAAGDGNDLRLNLNNAASGQTIGIESLRFDENNSVSVIASATIGDGQPNTKATIGGNVVVILDYPLQLANPGSGNIFATTIANVYHEENGFDATDPATYNNAGSVTISDSLGNSHMLTQYFVRQNDLGGTQPNRWVLHVLIDGRNVGPNDSNGNPTLAAFDLAFDSNGQIDTAGTDAIEIPVWTPVDGNGNPNGAATARITISIAGSTQFGGPFALTNVQIN